MILVLDNYDSFTYNLVQYLGELGAEVWVERNNQITLDEIERRQPERIVLSPGPCRPEKAGISLELVRRFAGQLPIIGVCLGHQSICQAFGGKIVRAQHIMHGKTSLIHHDGKGLFEGFANPYQAVRYHSLSIQKETLPDCFEVTAWTLNANGTVEEIMGIRHREYPLVGVQFHPESILTENGHKLLDHFLHDCL